MLKFYQLTVLVAPKAQTDELDIAREILIRIQTDGKESILCSSGEYGGHQVVKKVEVSLFPECLTAITGRLAFEISLPTRKDLGRKWFLKRLEGEEQKAFRLVAMTDVAVIHVEIG